MGIITSKSKKEQPHHKTHSDEITAGNKAQDVDLVLPRPIGVGNEITIKGRVAADVTHFTIAFIIAPANDILYEMRVDFTSAPTHQSGGTITNRSMVAGVWQSAQVEPNHGWFERGRPFHVVYAFWNKAVSVYNADNNFLFEHNYADTQALHQARRIAISPGVDTLNELCFVYKK